MTALRSALYVGEVAHYRLRPKRHRLRYKVFYLLLDLDEIDAVTGTLRLFSRNRFNLFGFHDGDHGDRTTEPLRGQIEGHLRRAGVETGGPIRLLTMPRMLGYVFNPLSIYYCHRADGSMAAVLGVEPQGGLYVAWPSGSDSGRRPMGKRQELPGAVALDASMGKEVLYLVWCPAETAAPAQACKSGGPEQPPRCPAGCRRTPPPPRAPAAKRSLCPANPS